MGATRDGQNLNSATVCSTGVVPCIANSKLNQTIAIEIAKKRYGVDISGESLHGDRDGTVKESRRGHEFIETDQFGNLQVVSRASVDSLTPIGDLDGDGVSEFVAGAIGDNRYRPELLPSLSVDSPTGSLRTIFTEDGTASVAGHQIDTTNGSLASAAGDVDGDGTPDVAVRNGSSGDLQMLFLNSDGTVRSSATAGSGIRPLASIGDQDGDGVPDLVVESGGALRVLLLNSDGSAKDNIHEVYV